MSSKYILTDETIDHNGTTLYRIKSQISIPQVGDALGVGVGELGGWVESEANLSQSGNSWIYSDSKVYGHATVSEDARIMGPLVSVSGNAAVSGSSFLNGVVNVEDYVSISGSSIITDAVQLSGFLRLHNAILRGNAVMYEPSSLMIYTGELNPYTIRAPWGGGTYISYLPLTNYWYFKGFRGTGSELIEKTRFTFGDDAKMLCTLLVTMINDIRGIQ